MPPLSSNWARLKSTITPKSVVSKKEKTKSTKSAKSKKSTTKHSTQLTVIASNKPADIPSDTTTSIKSIQDTLWANEAEILINDIGKPINHSTHNQNDSRKKLPGKYLAIDCEFVGIGPEGAENALARVSIVNFYGFVVYDKFVQPKEKVVDWRTWVSGITPKHMKEAIPFSQAQTETSKILDGKILVGHSVNHDLESLFLSHPKSMIRDTTKYKPFREISKGKTPGLKKLTKHFLKIEIQDGQHSSVEDARATMLLFRMHRKDFEKTLKFR